MCFLLVLLRENIESVLLLFFLIVLCAKFKDKNICARPKSFPENLYGNSWRSIKDFPKERGRT
jgi:hypothetical protein